MAKRKVPFARKFIKRARPGRPKKVMKKPRK
jgi:hypothetical protein